MLKRPFTPLCVLAVAACLAATVARAEERVTATVAHIRLSGAPDETPVAADPLFGFTPENFKSKLDRIKKAKDDKDVQGLYLYLDGLEVGWGKLDELSRAVADFRKAGKKAYAYLEAGTSKDYLLALACDKVYMPESGWLMLNGMRVEATFYKGLLEDHLGVKADFLTMGAFKGAAEPFTRSSLSPENRQQLESVLDDYFNNSMVARIVEARKDKKWTAAHVKKLIDEGPYTAKAAKKAGLIDGLVYPDAVEDTLKKQMGTVSIKVVKDYDKAEADVPDFSSPLAIFKLLKPKTPVVTRNPKVAVVYAVGPIMTGKGGASLLGGNTVGSTTMIEAIRKAEEDETVKAIVLRVDSPGGSALASDLIWNELRRCKKPVVASMSDVAASGGYYISMAAQKIYAEPGTLTGSIGVVGGKFALGGLYDKVGIKTEVIKRGANAELLSTERPFSPSEKKAMLAMMEDVYDQFLTKALEGRKKAGKDMTREQLEKLAGGHIWTGRQAKENGLIDELGTLKDAIAAAWKLAEMPKETEPELLILPKPKAFLDTLMEDFGGASLSLAKLKNTPLLGEMRHHLAAVEGLLHLRKEPVWAILPYGVRVR